MLSYGMHRVLIFAVLGTAMLAGWPAGRRPRPGRRRKIFAGSIDRDRPAPVSGRPPARSAPWKPISPAGCATTTPFAPRRAGWNRNTFGRRVRRCCTLSTASADGSPRNTRRATVSSSRSGQPNRLTCPCRGRLIPAAPTSPGQPSWRSVAPWSACAGNGAWSAAPSGHKRLRHNFRPIL